MEHLIYALISHKFFFSGHSFSIFVGKDAKGSLIGKQIEPLNIHLSSIVIYKQFLRVPS